MEMNFFSKIIQNQLQKFQDQSMFTRSSWNRYYEENSDSFIHTPDKLFQSVVLKYLLSQNFSGKILELGAGVGANCLWLARQTPRVFALDFAASAIKNLKKSIAKEKLDLTTIVGDATDFQKKLKGEKMDLIYTCYLHLPAKKRALLLQEVYNSLNLAGYFLYIGVDDKKQNSEVFTSCENILKLLGSRWQILLARRPKARVAVNNRESFVSKLAVVLAKKTH
jgi:SAM-dependent methyltransferase